MGKVAIGGQRLEMKWKTMTATAVVAALAWATAAKAGPEVEVLHWWTSGGEAAAIKVLVEDFKAHGGKWTDMPVAGAAGMPPGPH